MHKHSKTVVMMVVTFKIFVDPDCYDVVGCQVAANLRASGVQSMIKLDANTRAVLSLMSGNGMLMRVLPYHDVSQKTGAAAM